VVALTCCLVCGRSAPRPAFGEVATPGATATDHRTVIRDYVCPSIFLPAAGALLDQGHEVEFTSLTSGSAWGAHRPLKHTYEFKNQMARQGCCVLDKVLGLMEMHHAISACSKFKKERSAANVEVWEDAVAVLSPCAEGLGKLVAGDMDICCCNSIVDDPTDLSLTATRHTDAGGECQQSATCDAALLPIKTLLVDLMDKHLMPECARERSPRERAKGARQKACAKAKKLAVGLTQMALDAARGFYKAAVQPKDMTSDTKEMLSMCGSRVMPLAFAGGDSKKRTKDAAFDEAAHDGCAAQLQSYFAKFNTGQDLDDFDSSKDDPEDGGSTLDDPV
jgi:hypothetical protein